MEIKDRKKGSYTEEMFERIMEKLYNANKNNVLSFHELYNIDEALDKAVIACLKYAIEKNMSYGATFEQNKYQRNSWIQCTFSDCNLTLDISISNDMNGNYYLLSYDNIRKVNNDGEYRFSIENIKATQDMIKEIANKVFEKFNIIKKG